jgi:protein-disulfide isomerase
MAEEKKETTPENQQGKTIVVKKSKLIIAIIAIIIIILVTIFLFYKPCGKVNVVTNDSAVLGMENATIYVVEFSDYECPFCQASEGTNQQVINSLKESDPQWEAPIPKVIEEYVNTGKIKLVFRNYPMHANSKNAASAARCAYEQGKFWEYHKILFEKYDALTLTDLKKYAADLNLNLSQFNECLDSNKYDTIIESDLNDGKCLQISGTPTFFIGNDEKGYEKVVGAQPFSAFKQIIESKISV